MGENSKQFWFWVFVVNCAAHLQEFPDAFQNSENQFQLMKIR